MRDMLRKCSAVWLLYGGFAVLIICIVSGIGYYMISGDYQRFEAEARRLREEYIAGQQQQVKSEVERVVDFIRYNWASAEERLRTNLKNRTYEALAIADNLHRMNQGRAGEQETRNIILEALRPIRFNHDRGYYFATGLNGMEVLFADRPELEGKSLLDMRDTRGAYVIRDMIELVRREGEGYYQYTWTKPNAQGRDFPKIAFLKYFAPFDGFIGTGEYLDDVEEDIQKEVLERIGKIRFGKEGYIFVVSYDGVTLMNGMQPELIGKNIWDMTDPNGVKVIQEERKAAEKAEGDFIEYHWEKPSTKEIRPKISFVEGFPQWRWMVGAGVYTDDIEPVIKAMETKAKMEMRKDFYRLGLILTVILVTALSICFRLSHYFKRQLDLFLHFFKDAETVGRPIATEQIFLSEFRLLGQSANRMLAERIKAEDGFRESEDRFHSLFSNMAEGVALHDLIFDESGKPIDYRIVDINPQYERILGLGRTQVIGKSAMEAYGIGEIPYLDEYSKVALSGIPSQLETHYAPLDKHFEISVAPWGNRGFATIFSDITESKKKEDALRESQQQLSDIIDFLPDATLVIDNAGEVIAWNRAMEEMTGIQAADMVGKGNFEYALPLYGERRPILIDLVLRPQEDVEAEYEYVERKGTAMAGEAYAPALRGGEAYVFAKASALFDSKGNIVGAIESIRDISERRSAEEALARAEERYRSIFENAMEGIYQTSVDGRFISVNPAFAHMLRYDTPEEVLNTITDVSRQLYVNPAHRVELLRLLMEQGKAHKFETQFRRKGGSIAWVALNVRVVRDKAGRIIYLEGTAEDISERKTLEAQLVQVQKLEAIGTLAGGIAHDFNNILAPIIGYSELALKEIAADTRLYRNIEQVLRSGHRAKDLVKQILTFGRKTEQERGPVQVSTLVKETEKMLRSTLPSTIEIRRNIDSEATYITVMADPTQIHQVLMNLCTNAAHAMREKGGVLSMTLAKVEIDSTLSAEIPDLEDGSYLRLSVSDTGHGMDEEVIQRIFDPYFTTKGPDEGTGLGLAVVYGIVKDLSGGITVSSNPGEGTTFEVFLPITETSPTSSAIVPGRLPTGNGRILVVDDEKYVVEMLKEMLEGLGYEVTARYSSGDALGAFQAQPQRFDLVITDQTMPHMTGTDLAKEILKIRPDIPVILCTGFSAMVDEVRAEKIGIKALLMKPVALRQMAEEIHRLLKQG